MKLNKQGRPFRIMKKTAVAIGAAVVLFFLLDLVFPVRTSFEYSPVIRAKDSTILYSFLTKDQQWRMKARLDEITPELEQAILYKEDKHFYKHLGVNPLAVGRAVFNNLFKLKRTSGASTITMQVARMLQPKKRSYVNKVVEMFRAVQLEVHYSKKEILQLYFNLIPYGSNIQGVKAASVLYFQKTPDQLSLAEITALSIIPNRPNSLVMGKDNARIVQERNKWLKRFKEDGLFSKEVIADAIEEPLNAYRHSAPKSAPQFAYRMRRAYPGIPEIYTNVNASLQKQAEEIIANYMNGQKLRNIHNASVVVIDNQTHEVVGYVGSNDFTDTWHNGQVDGVTGLRSPGSALKPLLYALCMDRGIITPKTVIADVPTNFNGYMPENYDLDFRGNITAEGALQQSLNIPAVKMLEQLSVKSFSSSLTEAGFISVWQNRKKVGLSMILGGCGVRLEEMAGLYSSFSNEGKYFSLKYINDTVKQRKGTQLLSKDASYILTNILMELHRPDLPNGYDQAANLPRIAWKTGTSYGRRDAWSIGYNKRYTIAVWIGNFNGVGAAELNGAGTATPLLFELFTALDKKVSEDWLQQPKDIGFRLVCQHTGKIPSDYCTEQVMDYYLPGISSNAKCDHQRDVWVSADEKMSYCTSCVPPNGYKTKTYPNISAELTSFYDLRHMAYEKIPAHNPACNRTFDGYAPVINSLTNEMTYLVADKGQQQLQLSFTAANDVQQVYWYINDQFFKGAKVGEKLFFNPETPEIKISCADDKGRNTDIKIKVRFM